MSAMQSSHVVFMYMVQQNDDENLLVLLFFDVCWCSCFSTFTEQRSPGRFIVIFMLV